MGTRGALCVQGLVLSLFLLAHPASGAGFSFDQQGARAMGMAGAFTAQADDPTAVFYNPAGLALLTEEDKKNLAVGATSFTLSEGLFQGLPPGSAAGTNGEQTNNDLVVPHAYAAHAFSPRVRVGLGVYSPFRMKTEWSNPGSFAGRFISQQSEIDTLDLNPVVAFRVGNSLGIGVGLVYRTASFKLVRRLAATDGLGDTVDVAGLSVDSGDETALGWNVGVLQRVGSFSWGATYRSAVTVDFAGGEATLTQISTGDSQLDDLIAATLPIGQAQPVVSSLDLPATASVGFALGHDTGSLVELDVDWTGWSRLESLAVDVQSGAQSDEDLGFTIPESFDDTLTYRLGYRYRTRTGTEWRLGYALDESPQPSSTVGPFLADADRNVVSAGVGRGWLDVAFNWIDFDQRIVTDNEADFNGNYRSSAWMVSATISH